VAACRNEGKEGAIATDAVHPDVVFQKGNWINRFALVNQNDLLAMPMCFGTREAYQIGVNVPRGLSDVRTSRKRGVGREFGRLR
jgi:hypothetical protein